MARDEADGATRDLIGQVTGGRDRRRILEEIRRAGPDARDLRPVRVVRVGAAEEPVELVEPVGVRSELGLPAEVPLSHESSRIALRFEQRGQRRSQRGQAAVPIRRGNGEHPFEPRALRVVPADQGGTGGRADRAIGVGVGQADAFAGEAVDVGCADIRRAVAADVAVPQIVHHDEDDVRRALGRHLGARAENQRQKDQDSTVHRALRWRSGPDT